MRRGSWSSVDVELFRLDYSKVMEELRRYAQRCVERSARAVILIGSLARGDYTAFSDADVVIVHDSPPPRMLDRVAEFIGPSASVDIESRVYALSKLIGMAGEGRKLVEEVVVYGKVLAGDETVIEVIKKELGRHRGGAQPF